jgi:alpha-L-rhamnosidase
MQIKIALISILLCGSFIAKAQKLTTGSLLCEYQTNPIGIDAPLPRFSWKVQSSQENTLQIAFEIRTSTDPKIQRILWNSGKVSSDQSVNVSFAGSALQSMTRYYWQVRIWDNHGNSSPWSAVNFWEMGLLSASDWSAKWIQSADEDEPSRPVRMFRTTFDLKKEIKSARVYSTARGLYESAINGSRVGADYLTPGWTSYNKRLQYQVYDVTSMITKGKNTIGILLGDGWYRGFLAFSGNKNTYGDKTSLLFQLEVTYADGSRETIISDEKWKSTTGPIRMADIYNGEEYDARLEKKDWSKNNYDDKDWHQVKLAEPSKASLIATVGPPVRKHETFRPIKIFKTPKGETVADFGQNLVGFVQLKVTGKAGDKITIHHAEVLDKQGNFYTENLRAAKATAEYTLKGGGPEVYEPRFTFFGFRYVSVSGFPGELTADNLMAMALYSDMNTTGTFSCSNPLVNQLQHNIQWGQKGNFLDVPTDCPQRDERLGWTGDAQVFSRTAAYNMNVAAFFTKWLKDVAVDQNEDGSVPFVIPNVLGKKAAGSTGWADVATIIPWNMYLAYGDKQILESQYPSMKAWVDFMKGKSKDNLWNTGFHFGDWLFYRPFDDNDGSSAVTDKYLIAQSFYAHSTQLLINAAVVLGKLDDVKQYTELLGQIKEAYLKEYVTPNGRLISSTQTAYVLALNFDLLPEEYREATANRLVENIKAYGSHLTTGFLGTPYLCHVLSRFGHLDVAYQLLLQDTYPSWLYPVKMGATTIWERWDGIKPDSTFQTPGMNSYNHYAYGAIGDWMYRVVGGIDTDVKEAGYHHLKIAPQPGGGLAYAKADLQTFYGEVKSEWQIENGKISVDITIPPNCSADAVLPKMNSGADVTKSLGSGVYHFQYDWIGGARF